MTKRLPGLRIGVVLLFLIGLLSPFASPGAGAQELTCDDFNSQRAAQAVLDADPSLEDSLDPDGDGEACNEDEPVDGPADGPRDGPADDPVDDPTGDPADDPTEEPADEPVDDPTDEPTDEPSADGEAYVEDVQAELDTLIEQVERFIEISELGADITQDEALERNDIAAGWVDYPDVAFDLVAPEGYEEIEDAYLDLADTVGEAGELWETYWAIPAEDDDEEEVAIEAFTATFTDAIEQIDEVQALVDDAGGSTTPVDGPLDGPADGPADEPSAEGDAYLSDVQAELDTLIEQVDRFLEIDSFGADATQAEIDELNDIAAGWIEYPDVAAELVAPEGYEDVEDAYLDVADSFAAAGELWEAFWAIPRDDPAEADALQAFNDEFISAQDQLLALNELIAETGSSMPVDGPLNGPADEPSTAGDAYVADVQAELDAVQEQVDRFIEIDSLGADATQDEIDELNDIAADWVEYPDVAAEFGAPDGTVGYEGIETAYFELADTVGEAGELWEEFWAIDPDLDDEEAVALEAFNGTFTDAQAQIEEVQEFLDEAGGSTAPTRDDPLEGLTDDPRDDPSGEEAAYLATVSESAADWQASIDRFLEILVLGEDVTDDDTDELRGIIETWASAPDEAADVDVPDGYEDVQEVYEDFAGELEAASGFIIESSVADPDSTEADEAWDNLFVALADAEDLYTELEDLLTDAGA